MNGTPVPLIVRVTKRMKSRRGASGSERARETNDETERGDATAAGASEKVTEERSCCWACDERHSNVVRLSVCT